jgi:hypothetical protein
MAYHPARWTHRSHHPAGLVDPDFVLELPNGVAPKWERCAPGRFHFEIRALEKVVGDTLVIDEEALSKGALVVEFDWPMDGISVPLRALFPDSYPRLRPIVQLRGDPSDYPTRHCSPIDGTLCLLGRNSRQWHQQWTLRTLLELQLADALNATGVEDPQGEPTEYWWNALGRIPGSYCLVNTAWTIGGSTHGALRLRYRIQKDRNGPHIQALVMEIRDPSGAIIQQPSDTIPTPLHMSDKEVIIPWVYIDEPILPRGSNEQIYELMSSLPTKPSLHAFSPTLKGKLFSVAYQSELCYRTMGLGWLFPFLHGPKKAFKSLKTGQPGPRPTVSIIPTYRAGEQDLGARVPSTRILRNARIAVIGIGAVGGPLAMELARNGCRELHLLDSDVIEPGNSIRWPLGASTWGDTKTASLAAFIRREYPWTQVDEYSHAIGSIRRTSLDLGDHATLDPIISTVDLVVDGTACYGVSTLLSDVCRARGIPLLSLYASPPVDGGIVARFSPDSACPTCLEFAYHQGTIERAPGFNEEDGLEQPPGCAEPTFTGSSFDLQELSLQAMRLIVDTLTNPDEAGTSVVYTLRLRDAGRRISPVWRMDTLRKNTACSCAETS